MENSSKQITDAERLELAKKLDDDLETFINSFEKHKYTEGWPSDRWEEEMEKHPFFMKQAPEAGQQLSPLLEGLQQLKYDPNENTAEELASSYKEDGNFNFKHKNYRIAIIAYTEGINIKCNNSELQASLLNNRSASHYFLQNYRSSLQDAKQALLIQPDYEKAANRAAHCYYKMELFEDAIKMCDFILNKNGPIEELLDLRLKSLNARKVKQRDARKKQLNAIKQKQMEQKLVDSILKRGIQIDRGLKIEHLTPSCLQLENHRVSLDENDELIWPVIVTYPEYCAMEFVQQFHENDPFQAHLDVILGEPHEWDNHHKYTSSSVYVYCEIGPKLHRVDITSTLGDILKLKGCIVKSGTPSFIILRMESPFEKEFLKRYN